MVGDMYCPGSCLQGWDDVTAEGVAYHQCLLWGYIQTLAELAVFPFRLVRDGLHV